MVITDYLEIKVHPYILPIKRPRIGKVEREFFDQPKNPISLHDDIGKMGLERQRFTNHRIIFRELRPCVHHQVIVKSF